MNTSKDNENIPQSKQAVEGPDPFQLEQARARVLHTYSVELLIKKIIWWICGGIQLIAIVGSMIYLFSTQSTAARFLCVIIALIAHGGMMIVVIWVLLTCLRMDVLRELKAMELQLAEFREGRSSSPSAEA